VRSTFVRNALDFTSWQALLSTLLGVAVFSLVVVGIRLVVMQIVQKRRERENRQINERLRALIAAYKTLGGSFTGNLVVHPAHLRELRTGAEPQAQSSTETAPALAIPRQGPARPSSAGSKGSGRDERGSRGEAGRGGGAGRGSTGAAGVGFGAGAIGPDHESDSHHSDSGVS
jgi:hypothetical protein